MSHRLVGSLNKLLYVVVLFNGRIYDPWRSFFVSRLLSGLVNYVLHIQPAYLKYIRKYHYRIRIILSLNHKLGHQYIDIQTFRSTLKLRNLAENYKTKAFKCECDANNVSEIEDSNSRWDKVVEKKMELEKSREV